MPAAKSLRYAVKMKFIFMAAVLMILVMPPAFAITTNELKPVLKQALIAYFENISNSKLSVPELRDLLISFFETPTGQEINLNKIGKHSGKLLLEIFNKAKTAKWTIMVFMNGDNNLEQQAIQEINSMEMIGSSKDINVIVQLDRSAEFDSTDGDWSATKRFYIERDDNAETIKSKELADLGEIDMGSPKALEDFVLYAMGNYRAEHYALILWNHGGGWQGLSNDDTDNQNGMSLNNLTAALSNIKNKENRKLDIIWFEMCLMSMLETYSSISEFADIAIGSEELLWIGQYNYSELLKFLNENPESNARILASEITKIYEDSYKGDSIITLSAVDLGKIREIMDGFSKITSNMKPEIGTFWKGISRANDKVDRYNSPDGLYSYIDMADFFDLFRLYSLFPEKDLVELNKSISNAIISKVSGASHFYSSGLSVYFPASEKEYDSRYEAESGDFTKKTNWSSFIKNYYDARKTDKEPPSIAIDNFVISQESIDFTINLSGDDISSVSFIVRTTQNNISIDMLNVLLDKDFSFFENGQILYSWDYTAPVLFNGEEVTLANLETIGKDANKFFANGLLYDSLTNESFEATLYFEFGHLTRAFIYIPTEQGFVNSPIEVLPDDIFIPYLPTLDLQSSIWENTESLPIRIGEELSIQYSNIGDLDREYNLLFLVNDLSDNFAGSSVTYRK